MALAILIASAIYISVHERVRRVAEVREVAQGLAEAGAMDKRRLRGFDALCLTPVEPLSPEGIRALRLRENASLAVFALHLNVTTGLVSQWESGEKQPSGNSLKLLTLIARKELQAVLDDYLEGHNTRRPHQGSGMNGRSPSRAFNGGMPRATNTEVTSQTKTAKLKAV